MNDILPAQFADLQHWADQWGHGKRSERMRQRVTSRYEDVESFYKAVHPRMPEILEYLNNIPLSNMTPSAQALLRLGMAMIECARCVEVWKAVDIDAVSPERLRHYYE